MFLRPFLAGFPLLLRSLSRNHIRALLVLSIVQLFKLIRDLFESRPKTEHAGRAIRDSLLRPHVSVRVSIYKVSIAPCMKHCIVFAQATIECKNIPTFTRTVDRLLSLRTLHHNRQSHEQPCLLHPRQPLYDPP